MIFESRELKNYAEPINSTDLIAGNEYFSVQFVDDRMLIPVVETLVYVGENIDKNNKKYLFQDIESYISGVSLESKDHKNAKFYAQETLNHIYEYEKALELLMYCSINRRKNS